jgi:hypothetical protein
MENSKRIKQLSPVPRIAVVGDSEKAQCRECSRKYRKKDSHLELL